MSSLAWFPIASKSLVRRGAGTANPSALQWARNSASDGAAT
jgi:hypothetical protein